MLLTTCNNVCAKSELDYDWDIRPRLSETCFVCHGPDEQTREVDFRLDIANDHFMAALA